MPKFKNALVSVSDKTGLADFIRPLAEKGLRVLSTGGTANYLRENGIEVVDVSDQTGFPEVMDGRVKTLHPKIHMALLARDHVPSDLELLREYGLEPIDLVVGNLYPFEEALKKSLDEQQQTEFIDIGGPSLLRASAKSYSRITVVCDPKDYAHLLEMPEVNLDERRRLASKVFSHVSAYDAMIAAHLGAGLEGPDISFGGHFVQELRYGENPQQKAGWFRRRGSQGGLHEAEILQGKALSYNNLLDLEAAVSTLREFKQGPAVVSVKHTNPCGVGCGSTLSEATALSLKADPVSVFGGIVALNEKVTAGVARQLKELFLECIVAPDFDHEAMEILGKKKNLRVLKWPDMMTSDPGLLVRSISGGWLVQTQDEVEGWSSNWQVIGETPSDEVRKDLVLAWKVCAHLKSNAIAIAGEGQSLGLGMGQVNRVDAVEQAISRMKQFHPDKGRVVLASDAFFPFPDSIEKAAAAGIRWVIQPGGSLKDDEVKAKAKELEVNLVMTGRRHFQH